MSWLLICLEFCKKHTELGSTCISSMYCLSMLSSTVKICRKQLLVIPADLPAKMSKMVMQMLVKAE